MPRASEFVGRYRWLICLLLFVGTSINYIDRQILSLLKPILDDQLHWTNEEYGRVNAAFQASYAIGLLLFGPFVDRFGTKIGYAVSIAAWSLAALGHGFVGSVGGFFRARVALGVSEGGNFPSAIKAVALWFPKSERAFATALFNSGANVGAVLAPAIVPFIAATWGWQAAFVVAGGAGLLFLLLWLPFYDIPERVQRLGARELAHIRADNDEAAPNNEAPNTGSQKWFSLLRYRQTWSFVVCKLLTDPVWWFFLIWLPELFQEDARARSQGERAVFGLDLFDRDRAQHRRRLAHGLPHQTGPHAGARSQARHARLRAVRRADSIRDQDEHLGRGRVDRHSRRGSPSVVGEPVYDCLRHVPQARRGLCGGPGRHGRLTRRHRLSDPRRQTARSLHQAWRHYRGLRHSVRLLRLRVLARVRHQSPARAQIRARH